MTALAYDIDRAVDWPRVTLRAYRGGLQILPLEVVSKPIRDISLHQLLTVTGILRWAKV
jgi:hypothetical protein